MDDGAAPAIALHQIQAGLAGRPVGFAEGVWSPEDIVALEGSPWILVSAMRATRGRGALLAVDRAAARPAVELEWRPEAEFGRRSRELFDPHGIDVRRVGSDRFEALVVDHGGGEAIDRLVIDTSGDRPVVVAGERISKPEGTSGNAVAFAPGGFVMTSMFDPRDPDILRKFARAEPTGGLWRWSETAGWSRFGPALSGANGVAVAAEGGAIVVSEWAARRLWRVSMSGEIEARVEVDFLPDNLRWAPDGGLLLAGQRARPEAVFGCEARGEPCPLAFAVAHVDAADLTVTTLLDVGHAAALAFGFGGATGALRVGEELWVASFTGRRIGRFAFAGR